MSESESRSLAKPREPMRDLAVTYPQGGTIVTTPKADPFAGAADKPVTKEQALVLCSPLEPDKACILPDTGSIYMPWSWYAHRLTAAFGPMGWAIQPVTDEQNRPLPPKVENNVVYREFVLRASGRFVASAIGECAYRPGNERMTWGDAVEGARSNALSRCCKGLGMASDIYDDAWRDDWITKHAVCVEASSGGRLRPLWRKANGRPLKGEQGHAPSYCPCVDCAKKPKTKAADGREMPADAEIVDAEAVDPTKVPITGKEAQKLHAVAKGNGWDEARFRPKLLEKYKVDSTLKLSLDQYTDALDYFKTTKP